MKKLILLISYCFLCACLNQATAPQDLPRSSNVPVAELDREYRLFVPTDLPEEPVPLLIAVHGGGGRDYPFPEQDDFEALAEQEGFIIAYPMSELLPGNEGEWQLNTMPGSRQDIEYIEALIDYISSIHSIDAERVYATGYSLGSMFNYELACHLSNRFAAVASYAGTMPVTPYSCDQSSNVAIMHLHGIDDWIISYGDSWDWKEWDEVGTMMDVPSLVNFWANKYNCQNESETDFDASSHIVHDNCDEGVRVEHHRLDGIGHDWPEEINGISTSQIIWSFLSNFTKS